MCGPKGYNYSALSVRSGASILTILVMKHVYDFWTVVFFILIAKAINKTLHKFC